VAGGRPTKYDKAIVEDVRERALQGQTDEEIAAGIEVSRSTLALWKARHPEFSDALSAWKGEADDAVEHSLYLRALGGDTTAMIFWLKNRRRETWRDKQEIEHSATGDLAAAIMARRAKAAG
jgi:hypothetical protein